MVKTARSFTGFPVGAVRFLADLARNNNKAWFDASVLRLGVGVNEFDARTLDAYRQSVARSTAARVFGAATDRAEGNGHTILGDTLARLPPAYADHRDNALLKRKGFFVREETALPNQLHGPEFVAYCAARFKPYAPLFKELRRIALEAMG